jgi:hypothetical protein
MLVKVKLLLDMKLLSSPVNSALLPVQNLLPVLSMLSNNNFKKCLDKQTSGNMSEILLLVKNLYCMLF